MSGTNSRHMTHKNTAWKAPLEVTPCSPPLAAAQQMSRGSVSMSLAVPRMAPLGASSVPTVAGWNACPEPAAFSCCSLFNHRPYLRGSITSAGTLSGGGLMVDAQGTAGGAGHHWRCWALCPWPCLQPGISQVPSH